MEENKNVNIENTEEIDQEQAQQAEEELLNALGAAASSNGKPEKQKKSWKQELREWVVSIAVALMVVFFIRNFLFQIIRVDGDSMSTTLLNNERLFVTVLDVKLGGADRNDIVICHYPGRGSVNFVKRVVAVEGDSVYRKNGVTHVVYETTNEAGETIEVDEMLDERYGMYYSEGSAEDYEPYVLQEDEYFVVGDNRYNSHDSRDWNDLSPVNNVGPITEDMIVGRVRTVIWPLSEIRGAK